MATILKIIATETRFLHTKKKNQTDRIVNEVLYFSSIRIMSNRSPSK